MPAPDEGITEHLIVPRPEPGRSGFAAELTYVPAQAPRPGVLLVHEVFGLNDSNRHTARRLARAGYAVLAVDLFSGMSRLLCTLRAVAGTLLWPLRNRPLDELRRALDVLSARPEVDAGRLAALGFSMGGGFALQLACVDPRLRAVSTFYGQNPRPLAALAGACPVMASFAEHDWTTRGVASKLTGALCAYGIPHDVQTYAGRRHSFFNELEAAYDEEAAMDAWQRTLAGFDRYLALPEPDCGDG